MTKPNQTNNTAKTRGNVETIARNAFWRGLELFFGFALVFLTSIPIARVMGPEKLGYYAFLILVTQFATTLGSFGIHTATRKYMSEYLGRGQGQVARAIFFWTLRFQIWISLAATIAGMILVFTVGDPAYRLVSALMVASMFPGMVALIPSLANLASEDVSKNVLPSVAGGVTYIVFVALSLTLGWGLVGISLGVLAWKLVELVLKMRAVLAWVGPLPKGEVPPELRQRIFTFSAQGVVLLVLSMVVWDRSDMFFLKMLVPDIKQVAFFSLAFNIADRILLLPRLLGSNTGVTLMVEYGRDKTRLGTMVATSARYLALCALPALLGVAVLSSPLIRLLYGIEYLPTIPVLALVAVLAIPKAFLLPAQELLLAAEQQGFLVRWGLVCGALNVLLDVLLIPPYFAIGAAIANGTTQTVAVIGIWARARSLFNIELSFASLGKIAVSSMIMAGAAGALTSLFPPWIALPVGLLSGIALFLAMLRLTRALEETDLLRYLGLRHLLPVAMRPPMDYLFRTLLPGSKPGLGETNRGF